MANVPRAIVVLEADDDTGSIRGATKHFASPKNTATLTICLQRNHPVYGEREFLANPKWTVLYTIPGRRRRPGKFLNIFCTLDIGSL